MVNLQHLVVGGQQLLSLPEALQGGSCGRHLRVLSVYLIEPPGRGGFEVRHRSHKEGRIGILPLPLFHELVQPLLELGDQLVLQG